LASEMKQYRRQLERLGFVVTKTRGGHWRFEHAQMDEPVFGADTPSDHRAMKNLFATVRRKMRAPVI
jgi:hypothetical protein